MSRDTDAKVAEALGWKRHIRSGRYGPETYFTMDDAPMSPWWFLETPPGSYQGEPPLLLPAYSTDPAAALAALEATGEICILAMQGGKVWICRPGEREQTALDRDPDGVGQPWPAAACAAILAWAESKGKA